MRRAAFLLGIVLAALLGGAIYVSAQPTGGTAPPFPYNPARYKDAPAPPTDVPELEMWGGSGMWRLGEFDETGTQMLTSRLVLDWTSWNEGRNSKTRPDNLMLRFENAFGVDGQGKRLGIEVTPSPSPWKPETRYCPGDLVSAFPSSEAVYTPEACGRSGTTMPIAREGATTLWPIGWHPWTRYAHENRVALRYGVGAIGGAHRYRVNAGGAGQTCWTGAYQNGALYFLPLASYPTSSGSVVDGTCTMEWEGTHTVNNVVDGSIIWDRVAAGSFYGKPSIELHSASDTGGGQVVARHRDNTAGPVLGHLGRINGIPTGTPDDTPYFASWVPSFRDWRPSASVQTRLVEGSPAFAMQFTTPHADDPRGAVQLAPIDGSIGGKAVPAGWWYFAYAFETRWGSGRTALSPVDHANAVYIDGVEGGAACNASTGASCDAIRVTIREPVPNFANLVLFYGGPQGGDPTGTGKPDEMPHVWLRTRIVEDPDGLGVQTANHASNGCGSPCVIDVEFVQGTGGSEQESHHKAGYGNLSADALIEAHSSPGIFTVWAISTNYIPGNIVRPTNRNGHKYLMIGKNSACTSGGAGICKYGEWDDGAGATCNSGTIEPTWPIERADFVKDDDCTWVEVGSDEPVLSLRQGFGPSGAYDILDWRTTVASGALPMGGIEDEGDLYLSRFTGSTSTALNKSLRLRRNLNGGGGIEVGVGNGAAPDLNLYRGGPDQWKTNDDLLLRGTVSSQAVWLRRSDPSPYADGGGISFGPSSTGSADTGIFRVDPSYLGTEDNLWITGGRLEVGLNAEVVLDDQLGASAGSAGIAAGPGGPLDVMLLRMGAGNWGIQGSTNAIALSYRNNAGAQLWSTRVNSAQLWSLQNAGGLNVFEAEANAPRTVHIDSDGDWCSSGGASITNCPAGAAFAVDSTTGGLLPPKMTTAQRDAISTPQEGLVVFNTTTESHELLVNDRWHPMDSKQSIEDAVFNSGGPFVGISVYKHQTTFEDFKKFLDDVDTPASPPAEWANSGWTVMDQNTTMPTGATGDHLRAIGEGVLMVSAGSKANAGIQARHDTRARLTGTPGSIFLLPFYKWAVWQAANLTGYNLGWAAEITIASGNGEAWTSDALVGLAFADDNISPDSSGIITCATSWQGGGGIIFQVDRSGILHLYACNGVTLTDRSVNISAALADGFEVLRVGYAFVQASTTDGNGTMTGFYQLLGSDPLDQIVWTQLSTEATGTLFPASITQSDFVVEVHSSTATQGAFMAVDWVAGMVTKEAAVGTF